MEEHKINFFQRIFKSITDFKFYMHIIKESLGRAFLYLVFLALLLGVVGLIRPIIEINIGINLAIQYFQADVPEFTFANGELDVQGEMPIIQGEEGGPVFIIDTSGQLDETILDGYESGVFISRYELINKENGYEKRRINFTQLGELRFTKSDVERWLPHLRWIHLVVIIFGLAGAILIKFISTFFISILGLIVNAIKKAGLSYKDIYKLGIYGITLPAIIQMVISLIPIDIPFFSVIYYGIVVFYLWKAMDEIKKSGQDKSGNDELTDIL